MISWWSARPRLDWLIAIGIVVSWRFVRAVDMVGPLALGDHLARRAIYTQAGTMGTAIIGLFVVPVSLTLALAPRERLRRVLSHKQGQLRAAVMQAGVAATVLVVFTVLAVALEATPSGNRLLRVVAPGILTAALLSLIRVLRVLGALLLLVEVEARPSIADHIRPLANEHPAAAEIERTARENR